MDEFTRTILVGLKKYGRNKTVKEILDEAGIDSTDDVRLMIATTLERAGMIRDVSYQLPIAIRAILTERGMNAVAELESKS